MHLGDQKNEGRAEGGIMIKTATLEDLDELTKLFDLYMIFYKKPSDISRHKEYLSDRMKNGEADVFLAYVEGIDAPVGFTLVYQTFSSVILGRLLILNDLYVVKDCRGKGAAQKLIARVQRLAEETGAARVSLRTAGDNHAAQKLYDQCGFVRDDIFLTYHYYPA